MRFFKTTKAVFDTDAQISFYLFKSDTLSQKVKWWNNSILLERDFGPFLAPMEGLRAPELPGVNPGDRPQELGGDSKAI